jgi:hypothetical protein
LWRAAGLTIDPELTSGFEVDNIAPLLGERIG